MYGGEEELKYIIQILTVKIIKKGHHMSCISLIFLNLIIQIVCNLPIAFPIPISIFSNF